MVSEKEINELVSELKKNDDIIEVWTSEIGASWADVCVVYSRRQLPTGFLEVVSEYGDLYVEGTNGEQTELTIQL